MTDLKQANQSRQQQELLAQLALQSQSQDKGPCLDDLQLAQLVDGRLSAQEQERAWRHLAGCPHCYERWLLVSSALPGKKNWKRPLLSVAGGLLAAAASVMLYLNIQGPPALTSLPRQTDDAIEQEAMVPQLDTSPEMAPLGRAGGKQPAVPLATEQKMKEVLPAPPPQQERSKAAPSPPPRSRKSYRAASQAVAEFDDFALLEEQQQPQLSGELTMIDIKQLLPTLLQRSAKLSAGESITVKTYKRDRGLSICRQGDGQLLIEEFGFQQRSVSSSDEKLKKTLKTIIKREFPRSNKVWLQQGLPCGSSTDQQGS